MATDDIIVRDSDLGCNPRAIERDVKGRRRKEGMLREALVDRDLFGQSRKASSIGHVADVLISLKESRCTEQRHG